MPALNIYYFVIKPLQINVATGGSGTIIEAPGMSSPVVQSIFTDFRSNLIDLMNQAKAHIPHAPSRTSTTINVTEIPAAADNPTRPDFSGLSINIGDPVVYFTAREMSERPADPLDRRPEYAMLEAIRNARVQEFPESWVRDQREVLRSAGEHSGLSLPGISGTSFPVIACAFSNARQNFEATNWRDLLARNLATAAFHEIAHCKAETDNRPDNPRWSDARSDSIHSESGVSILASNGVGRTPTPDDFELMGAHMLCPIIFYRLDDNIDDQCFSNGRIATLTPR
ncbi:MAG: hypothetical protein IPM56_01090 [Ignavibacteriales bacterium]|nr:MAG: hypothetical protein IPM56_01090 [Ignavibacteriales bacterium]